MIKDFEGNVRVFVLHQDKLYELKEGLEKPFDGKFNNFYHIYRIH